MTTNDHPTQGWTRDRMAARAAQKHEVTTMRERETA